MLFIQTKILKKKKQKPNQAAYKGLYISHGQAEFTPGMQDWYNIQKNQSM